MSGDSPIHPGAVYLNPDQCARILQVDVPSIIRLIEVGRLPAIDVGLGPAREWRVHPDDIPKVHRAASSATQKPSPLIPAPRTRDEIVDELTQLEAAIAANPRRRLLRHLRVRLQNDLKKLDSPETP